MLKSLFLQSIIFLTIFQLLTLFKESSMLARDTVLKQEKAFVLPTIHGEKVSLIAQSKTTVIYFFAPWCHICHASISNLQALYEKNDSIDVIAVALDFMDEKEIIAFTHQHQLTFPVALGNETVKNRFQISGYPSYYVLNEENTVVSKSMGYSSELGLYLRSL